MATFTTIPDTDLDANSPLTEPLMLALRDNPLAIQQGDVSAPKIANAAFTDNTINGAKILANSMSGSKLTTGTTLFTKMDGSLAGGDSTVNVVKSSSYIPPNGVYILISNANVLLECFISGAWRTAPAQTGSGAIVSDGTNVRIRNPSATIDYTIYIKKAG